MEKLGIHLWRVTLLLICMLSLVTLSACSTVTPQGGTEQEVTAELYTEPSVLKVGQELTLIAKVIGLQTLKNVELYFELKKDGTGKSKLIKIEQETDGEFTAPFTPDEAGNYAVIIHIINPDLHVTVKKEIVVGE